VKVSIFFADGRILTTMDILAAELVQAEMGKSLRWTKTKGVWTFTKGGKVVATASAAASALAGGRSTVTSAQAAGRNPEASPPKRHIINEPTHALSVRQPWASAIISLGKDVENRRKPCPARWIGKRVFIHAGQTVDMHGLSELRETHNVPEILTGGIIGSVMVTGCVTESESPWFSGPYGWTLADPKPLPFHPCRGWLHIFEVPYRSPAPATPSAQARSKPPKAEQLNCLIIKQPYVDQILAGTKPIEYRTRPTKIRGRIGLVASGCKGDILGTVEIVDCVANEKTGYYEWKLKNPVRFPTPLKFDQRPGCVVWAKADGIKALPKP